MKKIVDIIRKSAFVLVFAAFAFSTIPHFRANADTPAEIILHHDGENKEGIGVTTGGTFEVAAMYPTSMTADHKGSTIQSISIYLREALPIKVRIYEGIKDEAPETLIYELDVPNTTVGWNSIDITDIIKIGDKDIWAGYELTNLEGQFPAGVDAGPLVEGGGYYRSDIINGGKWTKFDNYVLNFNLNIRLKLVTSDTTKPVIESFKINNNEPLTGSRNVMLTQKASDDMTSLEKLKMRFSNDNTNWSEWEVFAESKEWTLEGEDGDKKVFIEVKDLYGNTSVASSTIKLDSLAPEVKESIPVNNTGDFTKDGDIVLIFNETISAGENMSKITLSDSSSNKVEFDAVIDGTKLVINPKGSLLQNTAYKVELPEGAVKDSAGNLSRAFELIFSTKKEDLNPPVIKPLKVVFSGTGKMTLYYEVIDDFSSQADLKVRFSFDETNWTEWEAAGDSRVFSSEKLDSFKYIYIQAKDLTEKTSSAKIEIPAKEVDIPKTADIGTFPYFAASNIVGSLFILLEAVSRKRRR